MLALILLLLLSVLPFFDGLAIGLDNAFSLALLAVESGEASMFTDGAFLLSFLSLLGSLAETKFMVEGVEVLMIDLAALLELLHTLSLLLLLRVAFNDS